MIKNKQLYILLLTLLPLWSPAQIHIEGSGEIVAAGNAIITLNGDWQNNSSGNGYTAASTSVVQFVSSNTQTISGSKMTTFTKAVIKNTSTGGLVLNTDVKFTDELTLDKGILHNNSNTVYFEGDGDATLGNDSKHIDGLVSRTGTGNFRFEIGKGGKYAPLALFGISSSTSGTVSAEYFYKGFPPNNSNVGTPLVKVSDVEYWHLNSTLNARVRLYWKNGSQSGIKSIDPDSLKFAKYDGANWVDEQASIYASASVNSGYITTVNNISMTNLNVTFGSTNNIANPLPITLLSFTSHCQKQDVILNWSTASEENNDYFTLLRCEDAEHYQEIAQISGAGNSNEVLNYSYNDWNAAGGNFYYMLKQTDYNGKSETFSPIHVNCESNKEVELKVLYDNEQPYAVLNNAQSGSQYQMMIVDHTGRVVVQESQRVNSKNYYRIPLQELASGLYIITYTQDGSSPLRTKFMVR